MTRDNIRRAGLAAAILACACTSAYAADLPTKEITSNNIYGFAGNGDTLWMVTDQGLNFTIAISDTLSWLGYKAPLSVLAMGFGGGTAVVCLDTAPYKKIGTLWYYSHTAHSYDSLALPFRLDSAVNGAVFKAAGVTWANGYFWLACMDGGLARWDPSHPGTISTFFPNAKRSFNPSTVLLDTVSGLAPFPDSARRVIEVSVQSSGADSAVLNVLTPAVLYRFSTKDTSWDSLPARIGVPSITFSQYIDAFSSARSPLLFATIATKSSAGQPDTSLYRYDTASGAWITYSFLKGATSITFGPDSIVYLSVRPNNVQAAAGSRSDTLVRSAGDTLICSQSSFHTRIAVAMNNNTPDLITDVLYLPKSDSTGSLWIGAASSGVINNGLFFTRDERSGERYRIPFVYVHREQVIQGGLKQTYAYPGILTGDYSQQTRSIFAYSLSKASKVSIAVYDWNMDLVKNIITNEDRKAGKDDPLGNGRSTDRTRDFWDGTNNAGKRVAVGVYYFRITAQSGERSFGKIIVAK